MLILEIFKDVFSEFIKIFPILLIIYFLVEAIEQRLSDSLISSIKKSRILGPVIGGLFGLIPQCGFSVLAAMLYCKGYASLGTLFAVFIATSDEALPIMLTDKTGLSNIVPFLLLKLIIAVFAGYIIDLGVFLYRKNKNKIQNKVSDDTADNEYITVTGCCHHHIERNKKSSFTEIAKHALHHSVKIFIIIFSVAFIIEVIFSLGGSEFIRKILPHGKVTQPLLLTLIGLIPTCASSVMITEFYLQGIVTFGSTLGALCTGAGLGVFTLFKEKKNKTEAVLILAGLYLIGLISGIIINFIL